MKVGLNYIFNMGKEIGTWLIINKRYLLKKFRIVASHKIINSTRHLK